MMYDLAVVGGGPAGTSAAITAAGWGANVLLLDKGSFPRSKVCGEFVSAESLELLASLLHSRDLLTRAPRLQRARVFIQGQMLETPIDPAAASIARIDLDAALWNAARDHGVDARERQIVCGIESRGPFLVRTRCHQFMARSVVDASGRWSNLSRREKGNGMASDRWLGLKAHFAEHAPADSVDLYFFDGGYCGVQPVVSNGCWRINACAMIRSDTGKSLQECFQRHPELSRRSRTWQPLTDVVATSPLLFHGPEVFRNCILRAGDAAGFVDPFVGDGISLALRGGELAAKSLQNFLKGHISLEQAGENYRLAYHRHLMRVFNASRKLHRLFELPLPVRAAMVYALAHCPALSRYLVRKTR
jgi:flavin-dependent dehydrogenase